MDFNSQQYYQSASLGTESLGRYTAKTFGWMFAGLLITLIVAISMYVTGAFIYVIRIPAWNFLLLAAELILVISLSARLEKMSVTTAKSMFFLYSAVNGIVFSLYFLMFDLLSLWIAFGITAMFFGVIALIGYFGNINFSALRPFMTGGLIFLFVFWLLAMFIDLSAFETMVCGVGIFLFLIITAYDAKKIQAYYAYYGQNSEMAAKASVFSALQLYLDFINLFIYILRFVGNRKD